MSDPASGPRRAAALGTANLDFEARVDWHRLRDYRLSRARAALETSDLGALLMFDMNNIRYLTSTHIGEWARDKLCRFALLTRTGGPILWDFGSAAKAHRLRSPWMAPEDLRAGMTGMRGSVPPDAGLFSETARMLAAILREHGVAGEPLGMDITELPMMFALQDEGLRPADGQQVMLEARRIKSDDELMLLSTAAAMVDGVYHRIAEELKPGVRENEIVALASDLLYRMGSDDVECVNAVSGERCNPHPHVFADRMIRPGDQAFFDIIHSYNGYRTCYYRTFSVGRASSSQRDAYAKAREWMDAAIALVKPGVMTDEIARAWPKAQEFGFDSEMEAFALQFGHGLGLALHERPIISRLNSLEHPEPIEEGMVFALETYCPADDGVSAARIEEEVVVTAQGPEVITRYPADELVVTNAY